MIRNKEENVKILEEYLKNKDYDEIDILDLMRFIGIHFGTGMKEDVSITELQDKIKLKDNVVFIILDGFGYKKASSLKESSLLKKHLVRSIETVNPTSTACVLTSLASGKYPSEHGTFGWWQYSKKHDLNYYPILFKGRKTEEDLSKSGYKIKDLLNFDSILDKFKCSINVYMNRDIINSEFSNLFSGKNSNKIGIISIQDAFNKMAENINNNGRKSFEHLYIEGLDTYSHQYGVDSKEVADILKEVEDGIEYLRDNVKDTTIILTADHGQIDMASMIYLNKNREYSKCFYAFPSIDTRIISFFVKEECKEQFEEDFINDFGEDVVLLTKSQAEEYRLFGDTEYSDEANNSIGDYIAIVVSDKFMICDKVSLEDRVYTKGNHSGITDDETKIPLIVIND